MPDDSADHDGNNTLTPTEFLKHKSAGESTNVGDHLDRSGDTALIILNSPLDDVEYLHRIWSHACFRICADGGANRLHNLLTKQYPQRRWLEALELARPDTIHGDLDSLDDHVRKRYEQLGVEISRDPDQYSTDFGKAVKKVFERLPHVKHVLVLGSIGGRIDQGIGLLSELYREHKHHHHDVRVWLFSEASVSTILSPGTTAIHTPLSSGLITRNVGILSLYGLAKISTEGMEWDVQDWPTEMGGRMSTSNHIVSDDIKISTDNYVLFTVERAGRS